MVNTRHDAPKPRPRFVGLVRSVRQQLFKAGKLNRDGIAYIGGRWRNDIELYRKPLRPTSQDFHPTKGWGWASRCGKRANT